MSFDTYHSYDKLTIDDDSGLGEMVYYGKPMPADFVLRSSDGNRIYIKWKTDCCHTESSGFKLFYYCFTDPPTHGKCYYTVFKFYQEVFAWLKMVYSWLSSQSTLYAPFLD